MIVGNKDSYSDDYIEHAYNYINNLMFMSSKPNVKKVIYNNPATIVFWDDGVKTVVKCQDGDAYSKELGLAMCFAKRMLGNKGNYYKTFKKLLEEEE